MKSNLAPILLVLACLGIGAVLWFQYQNHAVQRQDLDKKINSYSNLVINIQGELDKKAEDNATLSNNLVAIELKHSNELLVVKTTLTFTSAELDKAQADAKAAANAVAAAAAALAEKDKKILELEGQNNDLDKESSTLRGSITNLETLIQATQKKLDASEGDKKLLMDELKRLQAQKEELERRLSDLASLQEQVRTLKENLSIARRLQFIQQGIYDFMTQKGAGRMASPLPPSPPVTNTNKSLDVEFHQTGSPRIVPPASTNTPATNTPSASPPSAGAPSGRVPPAGVPPVRVPPTNAPSAR